MSSEPFHKLILGCENAGGFRKKLREDGSGKYAYIVLYTSMEEGRNGITPLAAPGMHKIPNRFEQLPAGSDTEGLLCLDAIRNHYNSFNQGFEACATNIVSKMDSHFVDFSLTRPWRDGGRDALGFYSISAGGKVNV